MSALPNSTATNALKLLQAGPVPNASGANSGVPGAPGPQEGGRRMKAKKAAAAPAKKAAAAPAKKSKGKAKKGGSAELMQNVAGLAVPFAFLLAKQGLQAASKKSEKSASSAKKTAEKKTASASTSSKRRATMSGGANKALNELRANIDNFLKKY